MLRFLVAILLVVVAASVVFNAIAYRGAARARHRDRSPCMFADDDPLPWPARAFAAVRTFAGECTAVVLLVLTLPLAWRRSRLDGGPRRPVILIGGWFLHPGAFSWLARRLQRDGWRPMAFWRLPWSDPIRDAVRLGVAIDHIRRTVGTGDVDVIGHGTGGLVARARLRMGGVARLITLGTPHQGTETWPRSRVRPDSALIARLPTDDAVPMAVEIVAIYSRDDALVAPTSRAYCPGAFNIEVGGPGHLSLLFSRRIYGLVRENLENVENLPAETSPARTAAERA